ncbi:MAG: ABC transporter [Gammaproteobacteria bacterium]|nr:MAG: ABC transporter [Gammaproteobacteria bacterium]
MYYQKLSTTVCISLLITLLLTGGCAGSGGALETYNRGMYKINKSVDKYTLKPIAKGYRYITPDPVEKGVSNFFANLSEVNTFANSLLQGKFHNATVSSSRLVWNTTLGVGGIFDVATAMNIRANQEDFGQTLQTWGFPSGPYVVLPILGPSTVTDSVGLVGDSFISPFNRYHWHDHDVRDGVVSLGIVDKRARVLNAEKMLDTAAVDEYSFVKNTYLQHRNLLVSDGKAQNKVLEEDLDNLFGE